MGDNLGLGMIGHPLLQKARMVVMGMSQEEVTYFFRLDQQFIQPLQDFWVAVFISGIDHDPAALNRIQPCIHDAIACVSYFHSLSLHFLCYQQETVYATVDRALFFQFSLGI